MTTFVWFHLRQLKRFHECASIIKSGTLRMKQLLHTYVHDCWMVVVLLGHYGFTIYADLRSSQRLCDDEMFDMLM